MERRTKKKFDHLTVEDTTNRGIMKPKFKKSTSDFKKVRSSHRLRGKMYKSRFKNTIERPLVCSDSETSTKDDKDVGNAKTKEDDSSSIKNTQSQDVIDSQLVVHPSIKITSEKDLVRDPDDDFVDTPPPGKRRKSAAKRGTSRGMHQQVRQPYKPFTGARIRPKVGIDNMITLASGLNEEQRKKVGEIGFGSIFHYKVTGVPTALGNWLVTNYDPDNDILHVDGGRTINISSELVRSVFGLPMGPTDLAEKKKASKRKDVVVQAFREQFNHMDITRLSPVQLMNYILDFQSDNGRLFVLNFLVLYFSLLGETTTNNSVNVRFISNIQPGVDIKSFNWCAYMISCLKRTKTAWRGGDDAFRGPMLLLAIAYGIVLKKIPSSHSSNIIELVDDDLLYNLEGDIERMDNEQIKKTNKREDKKHKRAEGVDGDRKKFKKQKQGHKKGMDNVLIEDDDAHLGPDGEVHTPMASRLGDTPSAAGTGVHDDSELVRANLLDNLFREFELCVHKINNTITESCLMFPDSDLLKQKGLVWKELMKLLLVVDDEEKKDGDEVEKGDQNVEAENDDVAVSVEPVEPQKELDKVVERVQSEITPETKINISGVETVNFSARLADAAKDEKRQEVTVPVQRQRSPRPKRTIKLPAALRSPYVQRPVMLRTVRETAEETLARCIFSAVGNVWEVLFSDNGNVSVMRVAFESMMPGVTVHVNVISAWAALLNHEEKNRMGTATKLFCNAGMLLEKDFALSEDARLAEFTNNMNAVLDSTGPKVFKGNFEMVFIPMLTGRHYYLLFFNLKTKDVYIIDNIEGAAGLERYHGNVEKMISTFCRYLRPMHPRIAAQLRNTQPVRLELPWQTLYNGIDCGIFLMRHMESYNGTHDAQWMCCLSNERDVNNVVLPDQAREIEDLRKKYLSKMLLSDVNTERGVVEKEVHDYALLDEDDRLRMAENAFDRINGRLGAEE
ncbi:putative papain-like cysteine peptidase superfamily [Helianthus annuus]|nr:putative papain-like cysteine peptidase superfamily [Helianthus annuus]KAJ0497811.1 putative papain-like cysteine peptidase superfamily [Helianthus annuus]KAJ0663820.1 putative papain-like cysteine peptidase superfamily [Helianthus annuus]KAJ0671307.1 putative papain-like cysteine peptidase superfamily [Helianthus annuus]